jgi:ornithine--oxo-acid transaminase
MLMTRGLLTKDTHHTVIRFAPPLTITESEVDHALTIIRDGFNSVPGPDSAIGGTSTFHTSQTGRLAA